MNSIVSQKDAIEMKMNELAELNNLKAQHTIRNDDVPHFVEQFFKFLKGKTNTVQNAF